MFCENHSTCRFFFYVFVGKLSSMSPSSVILLLHLVVLFKKNFLVTPAAYEISQTRNWIWATAATNTAAAAMPDPLKTHHARPGIKHAPFQWPYQSGHSRNLFRLGLKSVRAALGPWINAALIKPNGQDRQKFICAMGKPHELFFSQIEEFLKSARTTVSFSNPAPCRVHAAHSLWLKLVIRGDWQRLQPLPTTC